MYGKQATLPFGISNSMGKSTMIQPYEVEGGIPRTLVKLNRYPVSLDLVIHLE